MLAAWILLLVGVALVVFHRQATFALVKLTHHGTRYLRPVQTMSLVQGGVLIVTAILFLVGLAVLAVAFFLVASVSTLLVSRRMGVRLHSGRLGAGNGHPELPR